MDTIHILAQVVIKPEFRNEFLDQMRVVVAESRKEAGNSRYELTQAQDNAQSFVILEIWESEQAIEAHNATPHFQKLASFFAKSPGTLAITKLQQIM